MLHKRSSVIVSFVEHYVHSNFKLYSLLILVFAFWFTTIDAKCFCFCISFILEIICAPQKKQWYCIFCEPLCMKHFQDLWSPFFTFSILIYDDSPKMLLQKHASLEQFSVLREWSSDFATFVEHPVHVNFKIHSLLTNSTLPVLCHFAPKILLKKSFLPDVLGVPRKKQWYCFIRGAPCI